MKLRTMLASLVLTAGVYGQGTIQILQNTGCPGMNAPNVVGIPARGGYIDILDWGYITPWIDYVNTSVGACIWNTTPHEFYSALRIGLNTSTSPLPLNLNGMICDLMAVHPIIEWTGIDTSWYLNLQELNTLCNNRITFYQHYYPAIRINIPNSPYVSGIPIYIQSYSLSRLVISQAVKVEV